MPWLAAGAIAGLASAGIGAASQNAQQNKALDQQLKAAQQYLEISVPDPAEQRLILQRFVQTGKMDPRLQTAMKQAKSEMSKVQVDPALKGAQLSALRSLSDISSRGGRSLEQDAYLQKVKDDVAAENRGRIGAIQSSFAQRGMGQPGGLEMQAQLANAQNETQRVSGASLDVAARAQKNALQAIQQEGTLAGQVRGQDFDQQAQVARAQDDINHFNTAALNSANAANVRSQNEAQMWNLTNAQDISNRNVDLSNREQVHNKALTQQQYENRLARAQGSANAMNGVSNQYNRIGQTEGNLWSGVGQGAVKAGTAAQQYYDKSNGGQAHTQDEDDEEE